MKAASEKVQNDRAKEAAAIKAETEKPAEEMKVVKVLGFMRSVICSRRNALLQ